MGVPGAQGQSPVINYVGPEDSTISSWGPSASSYPFVRSDTPRALALPSARLLSDGLGGGEGKLQDPYPDKVRALPRPSLWAGCPEPMFCQLGGWKEGLWAGVGWESQPWESTAGNKMMRRERESPFRSLELQPRKPSQQPQGCWGPSRRRGCAGPLLQEGRRKSRGGSSAGPPSPRRGASGGPQEG